MAHAMKRQPHPESKAMTEDEFLAAVAKFNNSPMNGRKSKEARK